MLILYDVESSTWTDNMDKQVKIFKIDIYIFVSRG